MPKPIESRSLHVRMEVMEKREGSYAEDSVAEAKFKVPFPATEATILQVFRNNMQTMLSGVDLIRGPMVVTVEQEAQPEADDNIPGLDDI